MQTGTPSQSHPGKILIVEDNELNLRLLNDVLEFHGYPIISTRFGGTVLDLARHHRPHLILLDIQLPDISGIDVARELKACEMTRRIPVIAVTAFAMPGDERKILESGIDGYIAKPLRIHELLDTVAKYLRDASELDPVD